MNIPPHPPNHENAEHDPGANVAARFRDGLIEQACRGRLVVIAGAGLSKSLTTGQGGDRVAPDWRQLIKNGLEQCRGSHLISAEQYARWMDICRSNDMHELLGAAEFVSSKLAAPNGRSYKEWLEHLKQFTPVNPSSIHAVELMQKAKIPICTLNYDDLLESVTHLRPIVLDGKDEDFRWRDTWLLGDGGIMHLHGHCDKPESCVLGIRDYEATRRDPTRELFQQSLAAFSCILFVGCGDTLSDPNFSKLVQWIRACMPGAARHYLLARTPDMERLVTDPNLRDFVVAVNYGSEYTDLPFFLIDLFNDVLKHRGISQPADPVLVAKTAIREYCNRIVEASRRMAVKGLANEVGLEIPPLEVDLERIYQPPKLSNYPSPVDATKYDFDAAFDRSRCMAIIGPHGSGKTLLLQHLALKYADQMYKTQDESESFGTGLLPVTIRCRTQIRGEKAPLHKLLTEVLEEFGNPDLTFSTLVPLLGEGRVLILIDGLGEIEDDVRRRRFIESIRTFLVTYPKVRIVITSGERVYADEQVETELYRFCDAWQIAPLDSEQISEFCTNWLQWVRGTPDSLLPSLKKEVAEISGYFIGRPALQRLAENPLWLTMMLSVRESKSHRPPESDALPSGSRADLYQRAVNIRLGGPSPDPGALDPGDVVRQLSRVAYEMLKKGERTHTAPEIGHLLGSTRVEVGGEYRAMIKRIEVETGLVIRTGRRQGADGVLVDVYEFIHDTFQQYFGAMAAVHKYYLSRHDEDDILIPMTPFLLSDKWVDLIPMAAVLARGNAQLLLDALIEEGARLKAKASAGEQFEGRDRWLASHARLSVPVEHLAQCLIDEAKATDERIFAALDLVTYFTRGWRSDLDWRALASGAYGEQLLGRAWSRYVEAFEGQKEDVAAASLICASVAVYRRPVEYWTSQQRLPELASLFDGGTEKEVAIALLSCVGVMWIDWEKKNPDRGGSFARTLPLDRIEGLMLDRSHAISYAAIWAWGFIHACDRTLAAGPRALNHLKDLLLSPAPEASSDMAAFCLIQIVGMPRAAWKPRLTAAQKQRVVDLADLEPTIYDELRDRRVIAAGLLIAYHSKKVWSEGALGERFAALKDTFATSSDWNSALSGILEALA